MKGFMYMKFWLLGIIMVSCLIVGFAAGTALQMESAFDSGWKAAIYEIKQGTKTAYRDGQQFFWLPDIPYRLNAISEKTVVIVFTEQPNGDFTIAGAGDEGVRKTWE